MRKLAELIIKGGTMSITKTLLWEFDGSYEQAIHYAQRIANNHGPLSYQYQSAADYLIHEQMQKENEAEWNKTRFN
jgi:hypothetical protein